MLCMCFSIMFIMTLKLIDLFNDVGRILTRFFIIIDKTGFSFVFMNII